MDLKLLNVKLKNMVLKSVSLVLLLLIRTAFAQVSQSSGGMLAKQYSEEIAEYAAKTWLINEILGKATEVVRFKIDALAASASGQLTSLVYRCDKVEKNGLLLGFYNNKWNDAGVSYKAYAFKNLPLQDANSFIDSIESTITKQTFFLESDRGTNHVYFYYNDIRVLIYSAAMTTKIRLYWNGFDS
jgi:hypothetical protein